MKEESSAARAYLDQLASDGVYDSTGSFTIRDKKALEKLGAFQLPRASAWVLKVVQCAVAWGADDIDVKQRRGQTSFVFAGVEQFYLKAVEEAVTSTEYKGPNYVQHLAVGLRAAGFGQWRNFELRVYQSESLQVLRWNGDDLAVDKQPFKLKVEKCIVELRVDFSDKDSGWLVRSRETVSRAAEESKELSTMAAVCPIPLRLDGRRLDLLTEPQSRQTRGNVAELCLAWSKPADNESDSLKLPAGISFKEPFFTMKNRVIDSRIFLLDGDKKERASQFLLRVNYRYTVDWNMQAGQYEPKSAGIQESWIHGVWDGVVCDSKRLDANQSRVGIDLYYSAKGLPTDISGLSLIEDEGEISDRRRHALNFAGSAIERLDSSLRGHGGAYVKVGGVVGAGLLATFFGGPLVSAVAIVTGIVISPAFVMGGIEISRANALVKRIVADIQTNLTDLRRELASSQNRPGNRPSQPAEESR